MALAPIIDLDEARRARRTSEPAVEPLMAPAMPMWCFVYWVPVYWFGTIG